MKIFLKAFAALVLLTLAVWAIRSDAEREVGNVNAAPLRAPAGAVPEDGLPALLRGYATSPAPGTLEVFPSPPDGRSGKLEPVTYKVEKRDGADGVEIRLKNPPSSLLYVFEKQPPHRLVRFEREDLR